MVDVYQVAFKIKGWEERWIQAKNPGGWTQITALDQDAEIVAENQVPIPFFLWATVFGWSDVYLSIRVEEKKPYDILQRTSINVYPKSLAEDFGLTVPVENYPFIAVYSRVAGTSIPGPNQPYLLGAIPIILGQYLARPPELFDFPTRVLARLQSLDPVTQGVGSTQTNAWAYVLAQTRLITDVNAFIDSLKDIESSVGEPVTYKGDPLIPRIRGR